MLNALPPLPRQRQRHLAAFALTVLVHVVLVLGWHHARRAPETDNAPARSIQWVTIAPAPRKNTPPPPPPPRVASATATSRPAAAARRAPATPVATPTEAPAQAAEAIATEAPATPAPSAVDIMRQARRSIGNIDRDLRKAYPGQPITAPVSNGATRLAQGLQAAADAAPNRWYEAPKVTEIIDPGSYARRRYRVVGADGTYCITVESNHAPDGLDIMKNGIQHKKTTCEATEQAATKQQW